MAGATLAFAPGDLDALAGRIEAMGRADAAQLADRLGALGVDQTKRRLHEEKTSPAGAAWKKNKRGGSILELHGLLVASVAHTAAPWAATWGSNMVYAAIHNFGGPIKFRDGRELQMPQREYLGLSAANETEMEDLALVWLQGLGR